MRAHSTIRATLVLRAARVQLIRAQLRVSMRATEECKLCLILKDNIDVPMQRAYPTITLPFFSTLPGAKAAHYGASQCAPNFGLRFASDSIHSLAVDKTTGGVLKWGVAHGNSKSAA
jgi:hypothetical protein